MNTLENNTGREVLNETVVKMLEEASETILKILMKQNIEQRDKLNTDLKVVQENIDLLEKIFLKRNIV
jgi:hypothetical protein